VIGGKLNIAAAPTFASSLLAAVLALVSSDPGNT